MPATRKDCKTLLAYVCYNRGDTTTITRRFFETFRRKISGMSGVEVSILPKGLSHIAPKRFQVFGEDTKPLDSYDCLTLQQALCLRD